MATLTDKLEPAATLTDKLEHMTQHNYVFVHIPKTAGRSILDALGVKFRSEHNTMLDYAKELGEQTVTNRYKFTSVRNPWARTLSWWNFFKLGMGSPKQLEVDFDTWVANQANKYDIKKLSGNKIHLDELSYCRDKNGELSMDYFIRLENINSDFIPIASRFNISPTVKKIGSQDREIQQRKIEHRYRRFVHLNPTKEVPVIYTDYKDIFKSQKSIDLVAMMNKDLIDRFKYTF